jgi:hypothetical protein
MSGEAARASGRRTVTYFNLYRISACLLILGTLGHTFGGMVGTLRKGRQSGVEEDEVFAKMKSVHFTWRGADCTWFGFWLGNGLAVSALLLLAITVLWVLGGLAPNQLAAVLPIAWAAFVCLVLLSVLGLKYFATRVGVGFGVIAALTGVAAVLSSISG